MGREGGGVRVDVKNSKKKLGGPGGGGGQGGCEQRIEVFVKIQKKIGGGGGGQWGGVGFGGSGWKFLGKFTKIKILWGGGVGSG